MKDRSNTEEEFEAFLYIITHDLKTFSRAMRVIPEWIEEDLDAANLKIPEEVKDHVVMLGKYARGMDRMLDGLTELSRVGRLADPLSPVALRPALLSVWDRIPGRDTFTIDVEGVDTQILAPQNDLDRLLYALLSNAVIHNDTSAGQVGAQISVLGERVILRIEDSGPGVDPDYLDKVFDPLFTLKPKDEIGTAGVGLSVARKVAHTLGGSLLLEAARDGTGLAAICDLPLAPPP